MALTEGDNRNALAAQLGKHIFGIPRVIAKINDPLRAEAYRTLGLETICRTVILTDALVVAATQGAEATKGAVEPPTAEPRQGVPPAGSRAHDIARAAALEEGVELDEHEPEEAEPEAARVGRTPSGHKAARSPGRCHQTRSRRRRVEAVPSPSPDTTRPCPACGSARLDTCRSVQSGRDVSTRCSVESASRRPSLHARRPARHAECCRRDHDQPRARRRSPACSWIAR